MICVVSMMMIGILVMVDDTISISLYNTLLKPVWTGPGDGIKIEIVHTI